MRAPVFAFVGLLLTLSAGADAQTVTRPPPPVITVGANLKELVFNWEPVPGAVNYRLYANTGDRGYFDPISDRIPASRPRAAIPIAVHKQLWSTTRYRIEACNLAGCTRSNEVAPTNDQMLDTIGYIKSSNTGSNDGLGTQVALSADGSTMAVSAPGEDGPSNSLPNSGAVYIYRRDGRKWAQEAMLKSSDGLRDTRLGAKAPSSYRNMGLSADGSTLAVAAPTRELAGLANAGAVYVFKRAADSSWSEVAQFSASSPTTNDYFGQTVEIAADGTYIKVSSRNPIGGDGTPEGRTHIWRWDGSVWSNPGAIAPFYAGDLCPTVRMTTNAQLLVAACLTPFGQGRLVTYQRTGPNVWTHAADHLYQWSSNPNMALNHDGKVLALHEGGGIGIFLRNDFAWVPDGHWLAPNDRVGHDGFGHAMEFSRDGNYLAFSDPNWAATGAGSMESWNFAFPVEGAVLFLKRRPGSRPEFFYTRLLKAPNPGDLDRFGQSVAFGGPDGHYLAIGAPAEDGAATGVDGNQQSEAAANSGAAYLY
jgi:hypothetical protein